MLTCLLLIDRYTFLQQLPLTGDPSHFIPEGQTRVWWTGQSKESQYSHSFFFKFQLDFEQFYQKRKSKHFKTTKFSHSFKEFKISFNMIKRLALHVVVA